MTWERFRSGVSGVAAAVLVGTILEMGWADDESKLSRLYLIGIHEVGRYAQIISIVPYRARYPQAENAWADDSSCITRVVG